MVHPRVRLVTGALAFMALCPADSTGQILSNGSFELQAEARELAPAGWSVGGQGYDVRLDSAVSFGGRFSLRMERLQGAGFGVATQSLDASAFHGHRITLSGHIRTDGVESGYAGLWLRLDGADRQMLFLDNMSTGGATGTSDWAPFEVSTIVTADATRILLGALMPGAGTAWYDELRLESVALESLSPPSDSAAAYLDRALDLMESRSIRAAHIDWDSFRRTAHDEIRGVTSIADVHDVIQRALRRLGDRHSFFMEPAAVEAWRNRRASDPASGSSPRSELIAGRFGHLTVPAFGAGGVDAPRAFAEQIQAHIRSLDEQGVCGWIVDLRQNSGGNMWPMFAGLGPILGTGIVGYFVTPDGDHTPWRYDDVSSSIDGQSMVTVADAYRLSRTDLPVAVLTGPATASSGEAMVVAFRARPLTRSFGAGTAGLSTANANIELSDGAMMLLTTAVFADRDRVQYGSVIVPDEVVEGPDGDPLLAAVNWLSAQRHPSTSACALSVREITFPGETPAAH